MRAAGKDIVELFGYQPDDLTPPAIAVWQQKLCPFTGKICIKTNHDKSIIYGTCSVTGDLKSEGQEVIICPNRFFADSHSIFQNVIDTAWPGEGRTLVIGGDERELYEKARNVNKPVIAYGKFSGKEMQVKSGGNLSIDWTFHALEKNADGKLVSGQFVALEMQSIDTTQNYRANWEAYKQQKEGGQLSIVPPSTHGLNWANVHKRLISQIVSKGNVISRTNKFSGFFFVVPDTVFKRFEKVLIDLKPADKPSKENLSVMTYRLGANVHVEMIGRANSTI